MFDYDEEDYNSAVAKSCKKFATSGINRIAYENSDGNISCNICKNWNGDKCVRNSYDNIVTKLESEG